MEHYFWENYIELREPSQQLKANSLQPKKTATPRGSCLLIRLILFQTKKTYLPYFEASIIKAGLDYTAWTFLADVAIYFMIGSLLFFMHYI